MHVMTNWISTDTLAGLTSVGKDSAARLQSIALAGLWEKAANEVVTNYVHAKFYPRIRQNLDAKWPNLFRRVALKTSGFGEGSVKAEKTQAAMLALATGSPVNAGYTNSYLGELVFTNGQPILFDLQYCLNLQEVSNTLSKAKESKLKVTGELPRRFLYVPEVHRRLDARISGTVGADNVNIGGTRSDVSTELFWHSFSPLDTEDTTGFVFWQVDLGKLKKLSPLVVSWNSPNEEKGKALTIPLQYTNNTIITSDEFKFRRVVGGTAETATGTMTDTGIYLATRGGVTVDAASELSVEGVFLLTTSANCGKEMPAVLKACVRVNPQRAKDQKKRGEIGSGVLFPEPAYSSFLVWLK